jgi:hypothetical protein
MTVQRKRGRPSDYCAEIAMTICDRLADGESLRAICADDGMPNKATVFRWIGRHKDFRDQYAWAREAQADDILDEIRENDGAVRRGVIATTVQPKGGRPFDYCAEIAMTICDRLADGESLRAICADAEMPDKATVFRWIGRHKDFRDQYALAREAQADDILEQIYDIAHDSTRDHVKKIGADGKVIWVVDREHIARCRLRINTLFRIVALLTPKKYGNH